MSVVANETNTTGKHPIAARRSSHAFARTSADLLACLTIAFGVAAVLAWHLGWIQAFQLVPGANVVAYNTALAFVVLGVASLASGRQKWVVAVCTSVVALLAIVTLLEYAVGRSLGIATVFFRPYPVGDMLPTGRISPNAALELLFASTAILIVSFRPGVGWAHVTSAVMGCLMGALGAAALLGYVFDVPTAYGWGEFTDMAPTTATVSMAMAAVVIALSFRNPKQPAGELPGWLPVPIGIAILTLAGAMASAVATLPGRTHVVLSVTILTSGILQAVLVSGVVLVLQRLGRTRAALEIQAAELARSNAELEHFAYVASHDLQEPLRMIASYGELLDRNLAGTLDEKTNRYLAYMVDGATRMQRLINDLLAYSRVGTQGGRAAVTEPEAVLARVCDSLSLRMTDVAGRVTNDSLPAVLADPMQLEAVFQNLITNALKFTAGSPPRIHVTAEGQGDMIHLAVSDNGIGIDPAYFDRIFVLFQRLHGSGKYPGSGLGLAITKKIVERHGGSIWVESVPGGGSTFHFTLPAAQVAAA